MSGEMARERALGAARAREEGRESEKDAPAEEGQRKGSPGNRKSRILHAHTPNLP